MLLAGKCCYLRAQSGFIVGQAFEANSNGMIQIAADILEQYHWSVHLSDQEIGSIVVVVIKSHQSPWISQFHFVQSQRKGHIFKSLLSSIAKDAELWPAITLTDRRDVNPPIVVIVEARNAPGAFPTSCRQADRLK